MSIEFLSFKLFNGSVYKCADEIVAVATRTERNCFIMACLNPHSFIIARDDKLFRNALKRSHWLIADGIGIVWGGRLLGKPIKDRVTGPDVFLAVMKRLNKKGGSVFFLGSTDTTLKKIQTRMKETFPNITPVGFLSPPYKQFFSDEENVAIIEKINKAKPDLLWVGMTAPKQERWLDDHRFKLDVKAAGAVGAAFDFFAETVKRSPVVMQKLGLEWLHRSLASPTRLGKRNATSNPKFVFEVLRAKFQKFVWTSK